jgi:hypothetical protein
MFGTGVFLGDVLRRVGFMSGYSFLASVAQGAQYDVAAVQKADAIAAQQPHD